MRWRVGIVAIKIRGNDEWDTRTKRGNVLFSVGTNGCVFIAKGEKLLFQAWRFADTTSIVFVPTAQDGNSAPLRLFWSDFTKGTKTMNKKQQDREMGRYRKKIADQEKRIKILESNLQSAQTGMIEMQSMVDALLSTITLHHGEKAIDVESGKEIGWRLTVPIFDVAQIREKYEIHARKDFEQEAYVIGVAPREK